MHLRLLLKLAVLATITHAVSSHGAWAQELRIEISASTVINAESDSAESTEEQLRELIKKANQTFEIETPKLNAVANFLAKVVNNFRFGQLVKNTKRLVYSNERGADFGTLFLTTHLTEAAVSVVGGAILWAVNADPRWTTTVGSSFLTDYLCLTSQGLFLVSKGFRNSWNKVRVSVLNPVAHKIHQSHLIQLLQNKFLHETSAWQRMLETFRSSTHRSFTFSPGVTPEKPVKVELFLPGSSEPVVSMHFVAFKGAFNRESALALKLLEVDGSRISHVPQLEQRSLFALLDWNIQEAVLKVIKSLESPEALEKLTHLFHVSSVFRQGDKVSVIYEGNSVFMPAKLSLNNGSTDSVRTTLQSCQHGLSLLY